MYGVAITFKCMLGSNCLPRHLHTLLQPCSFFPEYVLDHKHEIKLNLKFGKVGQRFWSPGGMVDPIEAPLMLAFNSSHARA